ncbi:CACP acetyltransferase, partial [Ramphastos sulfuratus]|nr:CACP acetyltransferase [Ramphastos sulfuratus]
PVTSLAPPQRLRFSLGPEIAPEVEKAKRHLDSLAADLDFDCFRHAGVGGAWLPPEAVLQVALQVAFYRAHGSLCASCEPTSLRRLLPGATDLLRPPAPPCLALATAMDTPTPQRGGGGACPPNPAPLPTAQVLQGQGPERHLQGLRQAALAGGEPLPPLFTDPAYALANHFRLCTLQV